MTFIYTYLLTGLVITILMFVLDIAALEALSKTSILTRTIVLAVMITLWPIVTLACFCMFVYGYCRGLKEWKQ